MPKVSFPIYEESDIILNNKSEEDTVGRHLIPTMIKYLEETGQKLSITSHRGSAIEDQP